MTIHEAIANIGHDPIGYFGLMSRITTEEKKKLAMNFMSKAKQDAKKLMAKHHPDIGGSHDAFVKVSASIDFIEKDTKAFLEKLEEKMKKDAEARANKTLISIG